MEFKCHEEGAMRVTIPKEEIERIQKTYGCDEAQATRVRRHYEVVAGWRVKLSDLRAYNQGMMNLLFLGLTAVALVRCCLYALGDAGQIFATIGYVTMFVMGLVEVPSLVQQWSRLRDIQQRMNAVG